MRDDMMDGSSQSEFQTSHEHPEKAISGQIRNAKAAKYADGDGL
jgi:hypothetical protein